MAFDRGGYVVTANERYYLSQSIGPNTLKDVADALGILREHPEVKASDIISIHVFVKRPPK